MMSGCRPRLAAQVALILGLALPVFPSRAAAQPSQPIVYAAVVDSIIHRVSAEYIAATLARADDAGAALVVLTLRTPGGLVDSTREIVSRMVEARTPVAVFVAPAGARAASAGFLITLAADVAAMAPGTHIGAAHPVDGGGQKVNETMAAKMTEDLAAYARTLAGQRHRNVALAAEAVTASRAFTDREAREATPPLIDLVTPDLPALLQALDGRTITRFDGRSVVLRLANATIVPIEMSWRQRVLGAVADPNIAYLLMSLGVLGLTIELWMPGALVPGIAGGLCLLLAFFAFSVLPVNVAGVLLVLFGLVLFVLELKVTSYGLLTVGGLVSLIFGSLILVDSPLPELQLRPALVVPLVIGVTAIGAFLAWLAFAARRLPAATGTSAMVGLPGETLTLVDPRGGTIAARGEIWRATAVESIPPGSRVRIARVDGLLLHVHKD